MSLQICYSRRTASNISTRLYIADLQSQSNGQGKSIGHFISLAKRFSRLLSPHVDTVVAGGPVYRKNIQEAHLLDLPFDTNANMSTGKSLWIMVKNAWHLFRKAKCQTIILQYSKPFSNHIAILLAYRKSNLYLIQYSTNGIDSRTKRFVWRLIKHRVKGIICPNENIGKAFDVPFCVVSDYIHILESEQKQLTKRYDFCLVGRITGAKGVIQAIRRLKNTNYKVLVAGLPQSDNIANAIISECKDVSNIDLRLTYLSEEKYKEYLLQSKWAMLNYSDWYSTSSSGAVFDALFNNVPIIGKRCRTLQFIETKELGIVYDDINDFDLSRCFDIFKYNEFLANIKSYQIENAHQVEKLAKFLGFAGE